MAIDEMVRKMWIELQKRNDAPVNAIGMKIDEGDTQALKIWREEGIDKFLKRD